METTLDHSQLVDAIVSSLIEFDHERPTHKGFKAGIGPFGEPQLVGAIAQRLTNKGLLAKTRRTPDLAIANEWAVEFKIVRPFGDNGREAEDWSVNMLHPYRGNTSLIGDGLKLIDLKGYKRKCLFMIGFEHEPPMISLDPLINAFELIAQQICGVNLSARIETKQSALVHPVHQVLHCVSWELH